MAGFTALGIGLLIGAVGSKIAGARARRRQAKDEAARLAAQQAAAPPTPAGEPTPPPDVTRTRSDAMLQAQQQAMRIRKRLAGTNTGVAGGRTATGAQLGIQTAARPRQLIGGAL